MTKHWLVAFLVGAVLASALLLAGPHRGIAAKDEEPIVAAVAVESETEYQSDSFNRGELRDSVTRVTQVLLIRADGQTEKRRVR